MNNKKYKIYFKDGTYKIVEGEIGIDTYSFKRSFKTDKHAPESINEIVKNILKEIQVYLKSVTGEESTPNFQISDISIKKMEAEQILMKNGIYDPTISSYLQKEKEYIVEICIHVCKIVEQNTCIVYYFDKFEEL